MDQKHRLALSAIGSSGSNLSPRGPGCYWLLGLAVGDGVAGRCWGYVPGLHLPPQLLNRSSPVPNLLRLSRHGRRGRFRGDVQGQHQDLPIIALTSINR